MALPSSPPPSAFAPKPAEWQPQPGPGRADLRGLEVRDSDWDDWEHWSQTLPAPLDEMDAGDPPT